MIRLAVGLQHPHTHTRALGQESADSFVLPSQPATGGRVQIGPPSRPFPTTAQTTCKDMLDKGFLFLWCTVKGPLWILASVWIPWGHQRMWEVLTWLGKEKYWRCHLAHVDVFQDSSFEICSVGVIGEVEWGLLCLMFSRLKRCVSGFFRMAFILSTLLGSFEALRFNCPFLHSEKLITKLF